MPVRALADALHDLERTGRWPDDALDVAVLQRRDVEIAIGADRDRGRLVAAETR